MLARQEQRGVQREGERAASGGSWKTPVGKSRAHGPSALSVQPSASPSARAWLLALFRS